MKQNELFDVLQTADEIDRATNMDEVLGALSICLGQYGLCACLITHLPLTHESRWQDHILANCWPKEWYQHYNAAGHYRHDPCVAHSRRTADPFLWSDVSRESLEAPARLVMHEATEFGLRQGICVPVHRSEEHTSELQSLMRISYAVFCLKKKKTSIQQKH